MPPHILFLTSTNLASNPRCRKEINLALQLNYRVSYIAFDLPNWTKAKEEEIKIELKQVEKIYLSAGSEKLLSWAISAATEYLLRKVYKAIYSGRYISYAISRRSLQLKWALKKLRIKPDFLIAHNPAAFYPAFYFSQQRSIPFALDIEDYHPGEGNNGVLSALNIKLEKKIFPFASYISFAAPLIKAKVTSDVLPGKINNALIVNNVFSATEFILPRKLVSGKLKLVWFSQNIDQGRGLEEVLPIVDSLSDFFELTLIGNVREGFYNTWLKGKSFVDIIPSLHQKDLNNKLSEFDIGLAVEKTDADSNRDICLTNKIWSYFQSGLFIIASDTKAQKSFIEKFSKHGVIVNLNCPEQLYQKLLNIKDNLEIFSNQKFLRFEKAQEYCWENESEQLQSEWAEIKKMK